MNAITRTAARGRAAAGRKLRAFLHGSGPTPEALRHADFYRTFEVGPEDVVFFGDSITAGAEWQELFPAVSTRNRGIAEETSADLVARLDTIVPGRPRQLFILVGINDVVFGGTDEDFLANYRTILARCADETPGTAVFVQTILPHAGEVGLRVAALNRHIEALAEEFAATFISLQEAFAGPDGAIAPEFAADDLHLTGAGYRRWQVVLAPYVAPGPS